MINDIIKGLSGALTWFFIVTPWEQAIRIRCGRTSAVLGAGLYLRIPMLDRVYKQPIRKRVAICCPQTLQTRDMHCVTLTVGVVFEIADIVRVFSTLEQPTDTIEGEMAALVADYVSRQELLELSVENLLLHLDANYDLARYGIRKERFFVSSMASARTLRVITGDVTSWLKDTSRGFTLSELTEVSR